MRHENIYAGWVDQLLSDVADKIQLAPSSYNKAVDRYYRIAEHLSEEVSGISRYDPVIYPQGSFRVGTTISAQEDDQDYDIDLILELAIDPVAAPDDVLDAVHAAMEKGKGTLKYTSCEKKKRCVTVQYSDMHLDITPAVLIDASNPRVVQIFDCHPDRPDHAIANPEGFAQWFEQQVLTPIQLEDRVAKAQTHPVPDQEQMEEKPLRIVTIQLLKRYRDRACDAGRYERCPSVLLSKLAAEAPSYGSLKEDLTSAARHVAKVVVAIPPHVDNPREQRDRLSDRWPVTGEDAKALAGDLEHLCVELDKLDEEGTQMQKLAILQRLFGERPARRAFEDAAARMAERSRSGTQEVGKGVGAMVSSAGAAPSSAAISVPKHKFYGD